MGLLLGATLYAVPGEAQSPGPLEPESAAGLPSGFRWRTVFGGLTVPTNVEFAKDGQVFVAEKSGIIKAFASLADKTARVYADLRPQVYNQLDRGLLGMALHPDFPIDPRIYVLYSYNGDIRGRFPKWPGDGTYDQCPNPPGLNTDGCVTSSRLSVLTPRPGGGRPVEKVLIHDWCHVYGSHSIGDLKFGPGKVLYASGGEGAGYHFTDYGQDAYPARDVTPDNPCGDPPRRRGRALSPPNAEGGALRAQDLRTRSDPTTLDGTIIRINPSTGRAAADNPIRRGDANARRIVAYGLRNPFRITVRPGTGEIWAGDVGWRNWDEIDRIPNARRRVRNFGWPCYEGAHRQSGYNGSNLRLCESLYRSGGAIGPYFTYHHDRTSAGCRPGGGTSVSGLAFYNGSSYRGYRGALFISDYSRMCVWAMRAGRGGLPDRRRMSTFSTGGGLVELQAGPGGDIFGTDILYGRIVRYVYVNGNSPPEAAFKADRTSGPAPLTVHFNGRPSNDANGDRLSWAWDLDGNGSYETRGPTPARTYTRKAKVTVRLKVTDSHRASDTAQMVISPGYAPPTARIESPAPGTRWTVGQQIVFRGAGIDSHDGRLPGRALRWRMILHHCPSGCHEHEIGRHTGAGGELAAPDHEHPSWLELRLTVTDSDGMTGTSSLRLDPYTAGLTFVTSPRGLRLAAVDETRVAPFGRTVLAGSSVSVTAPSPQYLGGRLYDFASWSDGGAASHNFQAPAGVSTRTATYRARANLAQGKRVRVSSAEGRGAEGFRAVDGNPRTRWSSQRTNAQSTQVDLGAVKRIGLVTLAWEAAYGRSYAVQVSSNGRNWRTVYQTTRGNGGTDLIAFPPQNARYVRMLGRKRGTRYGYSLWEFGVYARPGGGA